MGQLGLEALLGGRAVGPRGGVCIGSQGILKVRALSRRFELGRCALAIAS